MMTTPQRTPPRLAWIEEELATLEDSQLRRSVVTRTGPQAVQLALDGQQLINFGSNDYLGLAADPRLTAAAVKAVPHEGWGSGASPLICGQAATHHQLQQQLADFEGTDAALVFPTGFAANIGTIAALVGPGDVVYCDRNNHASLWDGCRLSRADVRVYPHADVKRLDSLLAKAGGYRRRLVVTDGLFSIDGDLAPLVDLAEVAHRHGAMLLVDEAHATGVFGDRGRGVCEHLAVEDGVHVRVGTLSKALGSVGGFVVGCRVLIELLRNRARTYMFSTAGPPAAAAAAIAALEVVQHEPATRRNLLQQAQILRERLAKQGLHVGSSASQIIPLLVGQADAAVRVAEQLRQRGLFVPAIRPPTVARGRCCLRISLTARHTSPMINDLVAALEQLRWLQGDLEPKE